MKKEFDLRKILKNAPRGLVLYSPLVGEVVFQELKADTDAITVTYNGEGINKTETHFFKDGKYFNTGIGECMLFPDKECRDWNEIQIPNIGDKVVVNNTTYIVSKLESKGFWGENKENEVTYLNYIYADFKIIKDPKFKVGDIVIADNLLCKIVKIDDDNNYLTHRVITDWGIGSMYYREDEIRLVTKEELRDKFCLEINKEKTGEVARWTPAVGEDFFFITSSGEIIKKTMHPSLRNLARVKIRNCFPTLEFAKKGLKDMIRSFE